MLQPIPPQCDFCGHPLEGDQLFCSAECATFAEQPRHAGTIAVETCLGCLFPVDECTCFDLVTNAQEELRP